MCLDVTSMDWSQAKFMTEDKCKIRHHWQVQLNEEKILTKCILSITNCENLAMEVNKRWHDLKQGLVKNDKMRLWTEL